MRVDPERIANKIAELAKKNPPSKWREKLEYHRQNWTWLKKSSNVAIAILEVLHHRRIPKTDLASKMNISVEELNKILKGHENLTIKTISEIEAALGIKLGRVLDGKEVILPKRAKPVRQRRRLH